MRIILERGEEALEVSLRQAALFNLLGARVSDHGFHLIDRDVTVLVDVDLVSEVSLEGFLSLELILEESVHLDEMAFDLIKLVGGHVLAIKHKQIIVEDVSLHKRSEVAASAGRDAVCGARNNTLVSLHIVVEATQVSSHLIVLNLAARLILEHKEVLVQVFAIVLHISGGLHATVQNFHEVFRVGLVGARLVRAQQVLRDVAEVVFEHLAPLVALAQLLERLGSQCTQIQSSLALVCANLIQKALLFSLVSSRDLPQVDLHCFVCAEQQVGELLQIQVRIGIDLSCHAVQSCGLIQCGGKTDLIQTIEEVLNGNAALRSTVPLSEDTVKIGARGVLPTESASNVQDLLLVDSHVEVERLVSRLLLSAPDLSLKLLHGANSHAFGKATALVWIGREVALSSLVGRLRRRCRVIASEDLIGPLRFLQLLCSVVGDEYGRLRFLTLSVIKFHCSVAFRVIDLQTNLFETVLAHGAGVGELERGVILVDGVEVALRAEVDIAQPALVLPLLANVHYLFAETKLLLLGWSLA